MSLRYVTRKLESQSLKERGEGEGVKEQLPIYQVRIYLIIFSFPVYIKTLFSDNILFQKYFKNFAISLQKLTKTKWSAALMTKM